MNGEKQKKELWIALIVGAIVLSFVSFFIFSSSNSSKSESAKPTDETPSVSVKKDGKPTPIPTENCRDYVNDATRYQICLEAQKPIPDPLNADVQVSNQYLVVTNNDSVKWDHCDYSIGADTNPDDFYELGSVFGGTYATLQPHQTLSIPWGQLTKSNGTRFNYYQTKPNDLTIDCSVNGKNEEWKHD